MSGKHVEPNKERSLDARIARLRERVTKLTPTSAEGHALRSVLLGVLELLDAEL